MKAVIFDRDGVILDSESINVDSAVFAFQELGIEMKEEEKNLIVGRHADVYGKLFLKIYDFSFEEFRKIQLKKFNEMFDSVKLFDKTISLIKELNKLKVDLALTTSGRLKTTERILKMTDLENIFNLL